MRYGFNIAVAYQDTPSRIWAMRMCLPVTRRVGEDYVQEAWHPINSLGDPGVFPDAVRAALAADVIVVSVHAADELPVELYVWIDAWLPRRLSRAGALAALIGVAEPDDSRFVRTQEYLRAVARRGRLDFISEEWPRLAASPGFRHPEDCKPANARPASTAGIPRPALRRLVPLGINRMSGPGKQPAATHKGKQTMNSRK